MSQRASFVSKWPTLALMVSAWLAVGMPLMASGAGESGGEAARQLEETQRALDAGRARKEELDRQAAALDAEIRDIRAQLVRSARTVQGHEAGVVDLEEQLAELERTRTEAERRLARRRDQSGRVLAALLRLARNPPEALIVQPLAPSDMVRSAVLLRAAVPAIESRAADLRAEVAALATARAEVEARRGALGTASRSLIEERERLQGLFGRKSELQRRALAGSRAEAERLATLASRAQSLRELLAGLDAGDAASASEEGEAGALEAADSLEKSETVEVEAEPEPAAPEEQVASVAPPSRPTRKPPAKAPSISKARGKLLFPVVGRVVTVYGQSSGPGMTSKGLGIETRADAQVIAPFDGRVVFAGQFRGYGELLIIEHSEGYHTLLAGMARIDGVPGQWLVAGEPVGVMGGATTGNPTLYVELRRKSQPINPLPWLAARKG